MTRARSTFVRLAGLLAKSGMVAIMLGACTADKANPVLPSTGSSNGWVSSTSADGSGGTGTADAGDRFTQTAGDASRADVSSTTCDLLKQDCAAASDGCYPVSGIALCQPAGSAGVLGSCGFGEAAPLCDRGLACIGTSNMGSVCLPMCDVRDPIPICGLGNVCRPLPGFLTVGYCQQA